MNKNIFLAFLAIVYCSTAAAEWIKTGAEEDHSFYVDSKATGKYWIRSYRVLWESSTPITSNIDGTKRTYSSVVSDKTLDCLFGNTATRSTVFYSGVKGIGESFIPTSKWFANNFKPNQVYDYRWFQFEREYNDEAFKYVCGDLFTLRNAHLFWKIPRQSPM